jgi:diguanylate cyclase (GGDEF)-like protein/PAS domain S-box-containing protein
MVPLNHRASLAPPPTALLPHATGLAAIAVGILVLAGWHLKIPAIIQIHPQFVPMQYNTALAFLFAGIGLLLLALDRHQLGLIAGAVVGTIGGLNVAQHLYGIDLGIDQLLMAHYITVATSTPGRMAPNTALCFTLLGMAQMIAGRKQLGSNRWRAVGLVAALVLGLSTVAFSGYVVGLPRAYGWGQLTKMAVHTALTFMVLGAGLLLLAWQTKAVGQEWRPFAVGVAGVTISITLWQALKASEAESSALASGYMLAFGLIMAVVLAFAVAAALSARLGLLELRRAQETLTELNRDFVSFLENTSDLVYFKDINGRYCFCSQTLAKITGHAHWSELTGKHDLDVFPKDVAQVYQDEEVHVYRNGTPLLNQREPYYDANGQLGWVSTSKWPLLDAENKVVGLVGINRDITELIVAEDALRESENRFRIMADSAPVLIWIAGADRRFTYFNKVWLQFTGRQLNREIGHGWLESVHEEDRPSFMAAFENAFAMRAEFSLEFRMRRMDGDYRWLLGHGVPYFDAEGDFLGYIGSCLDITERHQMEQQVRQLAFFDQLTGLPNRTLLLDRLKQAITASDRSGRCGALLFIDLDNFKSLNDTQGHDVGDLLLKEVARRLLHCVRDGDTVARLGGDEFVIVVTNLSVHDSESANHVETVAEKILATLNQGYRFGGIAHHSTASIGATLFHGAKISIDDLMKQADLSMYRSKAAGRNTICFFDEAMGHAVKERAAREQDLYRSLEAERFTLHYQAQVDRAGRITGAEALVRWRHPSQGLISPAEFIPLAEETGLIVPLGRWVLEAACKQLVKWSSDPTLAHLTLAVNVSAQQFRQPDFVEQVTGILATTGANAHRLKLELTESLLVTNVEDVIGKMHTLKALGIGFALDDFGTGYSSLSYLKRLPLDQLKIDQSFVRDVLTDANDAAIAKTIVALAKSLGLGVIAEGVETLPQQAFLAESGCFAYQGYLFSRPISIDEFDALAHQLNTV